MFRFQFADASGKPPAPPAPPAAPEDEYYDEEEDETVAAGVTSALEALLPWGVSIVLHGGIVLLALYVGWMAYQEIVEEPPIVPSATLARDPGAPLSMTQTRKVTRPSSSQQRTLTKKPQQKSAESPIELKTPAMGIAGGSAKSNPFGSIGSGEGPFEASMMGTGGNAKYLVYVIDASGSLVDTLPFVINELKKSVSKLSEKQRFQVIFFQDNRAVEFPPSGRLKDVTKKSQQELFAWLDPASGHIAPGGAHDLDDVRQGLFHLGNEPALGEHLVLVPSDLTADMQRSVRHEHAVCVSQRRRPAFGMNGPGVGHAASFICSIRARAASGQGSGAHPDRFGSGGLSMKSATKVGWANGSKRVVCAVGRTR